MSRIIKAPNGEPYRVEYRTSEDGQHPYEEVEPLIDLAAKAGITKSTRVPGEVIARAEAVMENIAVEFPQYVKEELERVRVMARTLDLAQTPEQKRQAAKDIGFVAHDLKGQGGSFGYPLLSKIAASLHHLIRQAPEFDAPIMSAIKVHIDSITLVNARMMKDPKDPEGRRLVKEVEAVTQRLVGAPKDE